MTQSAALRDVSDSIQEEIRWKDLSLLSFSETTPLIALPPVNAHSLGPLDDVIIIQFLMEKTTLKLLSCILEKDLQLWPSVIAAGMSQRGCLMPLAS